MAYPLAPDASDLPLDVAAWRRIAETLPAMVFTAHPDGSMEFVNRRWSAFAGIDENDPSAWTWDMLIDPRDRERAAAAWRHSVGSGDEFNAELRLRRADGASTWILARAAPLRDRAGGIIRWYGTAIDIDGRIRNEEILRERETMLADSDRKLRALADSMPVMCWTADPNGWIDWYNYRWYQFTGLTIQEAAGWGWQAAHHPEDFLEVMRKWPHCIATGEPFEMEFRLRRGDGVYHWFLTRAEPLRDQYGNIVRWYGSHVDIDAQKLALERTKRVAETLQDIFLPKVLPQKADLRIDAVYLPAELDSLIGGDWYDAFFLPDGRLVVSIGDVAGHGLAASMIVGMLRQAIFTLAFNIEDPARILAEMDRILRHHAPDTIVTALVGLVDPANTQLTYASAGHPPPLIAYRHDELARTLPYGGPPLGVGNDAALETHAVRIEPDAVVALYTDGMTEFARDVIVGEDKLRAAVALVVRNTTIAKPAHAIQEMVFHDFAPHDDAALLLLQFSTIDQAALRPDPAELERTWRFHSSHAYTAHSCRREIVAYLRRMAEDPDQVFAAELVLGEILANTVEHVHGLVEVTVDWSDVKPVVTVRDSGPGLRHLGNELPQDVMDEDGRGIFLIKSLADHVTVRPARGSGTELRLVLPLRRRPIDELELVRPPKG